MYKNIGKFLLYLVRAKHDKNMTQQNKVLLYKVLVKFLYSFATYRFVWLNIYMRKCYSISVKFYLNSRYFQYILNKYSISVIFSIFLLDFSLKSFASKKVTCCK